MKRIHFLCFLLLAVFLLTLGGCASNNLVRLTYPAKLSDVPWCRWDMAVASFEDKRTTDVLGAMDETTPYRAESDVSEWATRGIFEEMRSRGCACRYVKDGAEAGSGLLVTGQVLQVKLDKTGVSQWRSQLKINYVLTRNGEQVYAATHTGEVERPLVLNRDATTEIMAETLQDITVQAVEEMIKALESGKVN
ncbi:MAG: hypothetical protein V3573_12165 [Desulfovibrionaceae bacterium]